MRELQVFRMQRHTVDSSFRGFVWAVFSVSYYGMIDRG